MQQSPPFSVSLLGSGSSGFPPQPHDRLLSLLAASYRTESDDVTAKRPHREGARPTEARQGIGLAVGCRSPHAAASAAPPAAALPGAPCHGADGHASCLDEDLEDDVAMLRARQEKESGHTQRGRSKHSRGGCATGRST
jgi:hypothetical protein